MPHFILRISKSKKFHYLLIFLTRKTVVALLQHGYNDTAAFVGAVTKLWNCINAKSTDAGRNLNEENRQPFRSPEDERFQFLHDMADKF